MPQRRVLLHETGEFAEAHRNWQPALAIAGELDSPEAPGLGRRLDSAAVAD